MGSSPLARGLLSRAEGNSLIPRIIPARAGFTASIECKANDSADHPRSRGVYKAPVTMMVTGAGSSPLARGLLKKLKIYSPRQRIIPARAGFTPLPCTKDMVGADHPRSRGVYNISLSLFLLRIGSSPLARGLQKGCHHEILIPGIIPARAGFTGLIPRLKVSTRDHPRSRGVYSAPAAVAAMPAGSSPLARGLRDLYLD